MRALATVLLVALAAAGCARAEAGPSAPARAAVRVEAQRTPISIRLNTIGARCKTIEKVVKAKVLAIEAVRGGMRIVTDSEDGLEIVGIAADPFVNPRLPFPGLHHAFLFSGGECIAWLPIDSPWGSESIVGDWLAFAPAGQKKRYLKALSLISNEQLEVGTSLEAFEQRIEIVGMEDLQDPLGPPCAALDSIASSAFSTDGPEIERISIPPRTDNLGMELPIAIEDHGYIFRTVDNTLLLVPLWRAETVVAYILSKRPINSEEIETGWASFTVMERYSPTLVKAWGTGRLDRLDQQLLQNASESKKGAEK